jgi:hypothetical protein
MPKSEKWTLLLGVPSLVLLAISVYVQLAEREEHKAGTMSTIGIVVFNIIAAVVVVWTIYRNLKDAHRARDLEAQIVTIKDNHSKKIKALEDAHKDQEQSTKRKCDNNVKGLTELREIDRRATNRAKEQAEALQKELAEKEKLLMSAALKSVHAERELTELKAPDTSLRGRVFSITQDLLVYLKEKGCNAEWETAPPPHNLLAQSAWGQVPMEALESHSPAEHAALTRLELPDTHVAQAKMDAIHFGFERKFKAPLQTLYTELRESGIRDYELEQELYGLNPGHLGRFYCSNIRRITERLLVVWSRMGA